MAKLKSQNDGEIVRVDIPEGLTFPLKIDARNEAITGADGKIHLSYFRTNETNKKLAAERIAKFIVSVVNGSIVLRRKQSGEWYAVLSVGATDESGKELSKV